MAEPRRPKSKAQVRGLKTKAINWLRSADCPLGTTERLVWHVLLSYADHDTLQNCWPSTAALQAGVGVKNSRLREALQALKAYNGPGLHLDWVQIYVKSERKKRLRYDITFS